MTIIIPTRGERNNNPGNIDRDGTKWKGMSLDQTSDPRFIVFTNPVYGIRAIGRNILSYSRVYPQDTPQDIDTVGEIINRWAPATENNTKSYIDAVSKELGVHPSDVIDVTNTETMIKLVVGIIKHENGRCIYSDNMIIDGVQRALA